MKDEIKEILDKLKDDDWYDELDLTGDKWIELKQTETKQILDYITNLQQDNTMYAQLKDEYEEWLKEYIKKNDNWYNELSTHDKQYYGDSYYTTNAVLMTMLNKMKEIKEKNNV